MRTVLREEYRHELSEYLKVQTPALFKKLSSWPAVQPVWDFLLKLRLTYPEAAQLIAKIVENPTYQEQTPQFIDQCKKILAACNGDFSVKTEVFKKAQPVNTDEVYHMLRWCLTGDSNGQDPFEIAKILEANAQLKNRLDHFARTN